MDHPLRLEAYRRRPRWKAFTAAERRLLEGVRDELAAELDEGFHELVDVVDASTGAAWGLLALWPYGSGVLVDVRGVRRAGIAQHHFDAAGDEALRASLAEAWARDAGPLGVVERVVFGPETSTSAGRPDPAEDPALARVRRLRQDVASGRAVPDDTVWAVVTEVFDLRGAPRPLPVRRPADLTELERQTLLLVHEGYRGALFQQLGRVGLPLSRATDGFGRLPVFLGLEPGALLDRPVTMAGPPQPAWCAISDAVHDRAPVEPLVEALAAWPEETRAPLLEALVACRPSDVLTGAWAEPPAGAQRGSPVALALHGRRWLRFTSALAGRLGETGERVARGWLDTQGHWLERWRDLRLRLPHADLPAWLSACVALGALARCRRLDGGGLDEDLDPWLVELARSEAATGPVREVLADLPPERAARIAVHRMELVVDHPSAAGVEAAIAQLEERGGGPWLTPIFLDAVLATGPAGRPALEAALARGSPQAGAIRKAIKALPR